MRLRIAGLALATTLLLSSWARALDYEGVWLEDRPRVDNVTLQLNGAGVRSKFFVRVYVAALYTAARTGRAEDVLNSAQPRRLVLSMLRGLDSDAIRESLLKGLRDNLSPAEQAALAPRIAQLENILRSVPEVDAGDLILFEFAPGKGTTVLIRGRQRGFLAGDEMISALLRIWLGAHPVQPALKDALLGHA